MRDSIINKLIPIIKFMKNQERVQELITSINAMGLKKSYNVKSKPYNYINL